ncbi:MAG: Gfo/Idh/MocA family oxidoreductase [SAR324 cluster bacterium]|nr:Gfo/Idh/MocA family oxidoreductase [SAR324 cluster bacterium]
MKIAIIGCGLIGKKRAAALKGRGQLCLLADVQLERAELLAKEVGAEASSEWEKAATSPEIDIVIVATTHDQLARVALEAAKAGKHVLLEKPGARRPGELQALADAAREKNVRVHVGFNHRFHPAMQKAKELLDQGLLGPLYYIRGRYGHGGRLGYEKEWRANPEISGGGELLDQGAHLIDLCQWYFGESFTEIHGWCPTYFWQMPVEDNAFMTLKTGTGKIAQLQATWTEWKNLFSFEITGQDAKLHIDGLGGSYGTERLAFYQMKAEMGPPLTTIFEYPGPDLSWELEFEQFIREIKESRTCQPSVQSTQNVLSVIETIYQQNQVPWLNKAENSS